jgi:hypothetical protein
MTFICVGNLWVCVNNMFSESVIKLPFLLRWIGHLSAAIVVTSRGNNGPPLRAVLSQMKQSTSSRPIPVRCILMLSSATPNYSEWSLSFRLSNQNYIDLLISRFPYLPYMLRPSRHHLWFDHLYNTLWKSKLRSVDCVILWSSSLALYIMYSNTCFSHLFPNKLNLFCYYLIVKY